MISPQTIAQVAAANDIVEVIGAYVPLKRAGSNYLGICPFHPEKTPSFNVSPSRQRFHCFGCGVDGSVFKFVQLRENIEFPASVRRLAERSGIEIVEDEFGRAEERGAGELRRRLRRLHAEAAEWFHRNLMKSPAAGHARDYLKSRGLSEEVAGRWRIGYAPDGWDGLLSWSASQGYRKEEVIRGGLAVTSEADAAAESEGQDLNKVHAYDRFRDRLIFPICDEAGQVIAFSGRVLQADAKGGKYVNSPETALFTKGNVLFGLHLTKKAMLDAGFAVVCEGQIDLITAFEAGVQNVTAAQGTAFTPHQANVLKRHVDEAVVCFDSDAAGAKAAEKALATLLESNITVRVATMPPGEDPDSLIRSQGAAAFRERIAAARDFFDYQIDALGQTYDLTTPRGKQQFGRRMAESVSLLTDTVLREAVVGKVSARLGLAAADFRALLRRRVAPGRRAAEADLRSGEASPDVGDDTTHDPAFERPPKFISDLVKVALSDADARGWLLGQTWRQDLPHVGGSELLIQALGAEIEPESAAEVNAFVAALPPDAESFVGALLLERPFPQPLIVARDSWRGIKKAVLRERFVALESRLRLSDTDPTESARLQKEILDLQLTLKDIARL